MKAPDPGTRKLESFERRVARVIFAAQFIAAIPFFALAAFFAVRSWNPLGNGYFASYKDSPDGLYLTVAGTGLAVAAMFAAAGLLIVSRRFRRYGGFVVLAAAAGAASLLPYVLFKWTTRPETWPWAFFMQDWIAWLRFAPRSRSVGIVIQIVLAVVVMAAVAAQWSTWWRLRRPPSANTAGGRSVARTP